jgi:SAM-dependent methyltransferase
VTVFQTEPAPELIAVLQKLAPGRALDLACGGGRHAMWLAERGWDVTAVDREPGAIHRVHRLCVDLEDHKFTIEPDAWDLIVCWLYWQADLLPAIARGVRMGGVVAMAGKTTGRFATSLRQFKAGFVDWEELASGENETRAFLIVRRTG